MHAASATAAASGSSAAGAPASTNQAADLRVALDTLLSEHAELAMLAMQKGYDGGADFQPVADQLDKNSVALSQAIGSVYGKDAEATFLKQWRSHIGFFVDYTKAVKGNDQAGKAQAQQNLDGYVKGAAAFFSGVNPNLPSDAVAQIFQGHVTELETALNSYATKDYPMVYATQTMAIDHMFMTGGTLSGAITKQYPDKFAGQSDNNAANLRVGLDQLLSEHAYLAQLAMQKGYDGSADFQPVADQLDQNSVALSKAIGSVYGPDAEASFLKLWRSHIGFFVDYTKAVKGNDQAGKTQADQQLQGYVEGAASFLSGANPNLPKATLATALREHVTELEGSLNAYATKDFASTYGMQVQATNHMFMTGDTLAAGIVTQMPQKFAGLLPESSPSAAVPAFGSEEAVAFGCTLSDVA